MVKLGYGALKEADPTEFRLSDHGRDMDEGVTIASSARDSENTPDTTLRKGLVLGKITASGKFAQYDSGASDGTETAYGILADEVKVVDEDGSAADAFATVMVHGKVDESKLIGIDAAAKADLDQIIFR
jgi:hypothetical protein